MHQITNELESLENAYRVLTENGANFSLFYSDATDAVNDQRRAQSFIYECKFRLVEMAKLIFTTELNSANRSELSAIFPVIVSLDLTGFIIAEFVNLRTSELSKSFHFPCLPLTNVLQCVKNSLEMKFLQVQPFKSASLMPEASNLDLDYIQDLPEQIKHTLKAWKQQFESDLRFFYSFAADYQSVKEIMMLPIVFYEKMIAAFQSIFTFLFYYFLDQIKSEANPFLILNFYDFVADFLVSTIKILLDYRPNALCFGVRAGGIVVPNLYRWIAAASVPFESFSTILCVIFVQHFEDSLSKQIRFEGNDLLFFLLRSANVLFINVLPECLRAVKDFGLNAERVSFLFSMLFTRFLLKVQYICRNTSNFASNSSALQVGDVELRNAFAYFGFSLKLLSDFSIFCSKITEIVSFTRSIFLQCAENIPTINLSNLSLDAVPLFVDENFSFDASILTTAFVKEKIVFFVQGASVDSVNDNVLQDSNEVIQKNVKVNENTIIDILVKPFMNQSELLQASSSMWKQYQMPGKQMEVFLSAPSDFATQVGEFLFISMQRIEPIASNLVHIELTPEFEGKFTADFIMKRVSETIITQLVKIIESVKILNERAKQQLLLDFGYLEDVTISLGVSLKQQFIDMQRMVEMK